MARGWAIEPRGEYTEAWKAGVIQAIMYSMMDYCCEHCGLQADHGTTICSSKLRRDGRPYIMTVHHINGDKANNHWTNLLVCCQACHLHIQALWSPGDNIPKGWPEPPGWLRIRQLAYRINDNDQMKLF